MTERQELVNRYATSDIDMILHLYQNAIHDLKIFAPKVYTEFVANSLAGGVDFIGSRVKSTIQYGSDLDEDVLEARISVNNRRCDE